MRKKRLLSFILVLTVLLSLFMPQLTVSAGAPDGWRKLSDITIYKDGDTVGGWSGSGDMELETVNDNLPIDTEITYNNLPSLRLNVTKPVYSYWWTSLLTLRDWCTHDISQYVQNGYLEFNIMGRNGKELFTLGLRDKGTERSVGESVDCAVGIDDFCSVTTKWQHVRIPLKYLTNRAAGFDPKNVMCMVINPVDTNTMTVYLNDIKITSTDMEKGYPNIKVNQVGYLCNADKIAIVSGFEDELALKDDDLFDLMNASNNSVKYTSQVALVKDFDSVDSGERIFTANFSKVTTPGEYYIHIQGVGDSPKFRIGNDIYKGLLTDTSRYYYYQRANLELASPYCTDYQRKDLTPNDQYAILDPSKEISKDLRKGWYDAGDLGKYVNAGATAVSDLFWAYEMFPGQFRDNQLNIPESGNGVPDILDEARWELEWMLGMQEPVSGGFYARVQTDENDINGNGDTTERIVMSSDGKNFNIKSTDDTACAAAVLAHASLIYKDIDPAFSATCLNNAKLAWAFLEGNPKNIMSPPGPYNITDDSADRLWAAASLYRSTGLAEYNTYFMKNYERFASKFTDTDGYAHFVGDNWLIAFFNYLKAQNSESKAVSWIGTQFEKWTAKMLDRYNNNPWKNSIKEGNYFWGINMQVLNVPMDAYIGSRLLNTGSDSINKFAFDSLDWVLGTNPLCKSFVTGYGDGSVKNIYSSIYSQDGLKGVPKGYMAGGPNKYEGKGISRFAAKCYIDSTSDWVTNEHTIYWNSPLVFMSAFANNSAPVDDKITFSGCINPDLTSNNKSIRAGFKVSVIGTDFSAITDSLGRFTIDGLPRIRGYYSIEISKDGYLARIIDQILGSRDASIGSDTKPVDIWGGDIPIKGVADNAINMKDIVEMSRAFNTSYGDTQFNAVCDLNRDGAVNMVDIVIAAKHFNSSQASYPGIIVS